MLSFFCFDNLFHFILLLLCLFRQFVSIRVVTYIENERRQPFSSFTLHHLPHTPLLSRMKAVKVMASRVKVKVMVVMAASVHLSSTAPLTSSIQGWEEVEVGEVATCLGISSPPTPHLTIPRMSIASLLNIK